MNAGCFARFRNERGHPALYDFLRIRLTRIDHVIDDCAPAEIRTRDFRKFLGLWFGGRHPGDVTSIRVRAEGFVIEIESQLTELPKLIGNILTRVGHGPVRTYDNLVRLVLVRAGMRFKRHYPTAAVSTLAFKMNHTSVFHQLKSALPEMEMQNLRLARQQVVADPEPLHRIQNLFDVSGGDVIGELSRMVVSRFDRVKNRDSQFWPGLVLFPLDIVVPIEQTDPG